MKRNRIIILIFLTLAVFILSEEPREVAAEPMRVCRGDHLVVSAQLLQNGSYGSPVPGQVIEFYDETTDTLIDITLTGENGIASVDWIVPPFHALGPTSINATFRGNTSLALAPSCQWLSVDIYSETELELSIKSVVLSPLDFLSCSIMLTNDMDYPIINSSVQLFGNDVLLDSMITNSTGHAVFFIECGPSWCVYGENTIEIVYDSNPVTYDFEVCETFTIIVERVETQIVSLNSISEVILNDTIELQLILECDEGFLPDALLSLLLDDVPIETVSTNSSGMLTSLLYIDERFSIGQHQLTVKYEGSFRYQTTSLVLDITILSPCFLELELPDRLILEDQAVIELQGFDLFHRPLALESAVLFDNSTGKTVEAVGSDYQPLGFIFPVEGKKGYREVILNITGIPYITNRTHVLGIIVWTIPQILLIESNIDGYAFPGQNIEIEIRLVSKSQELSHEHIEIDFDGTRETYVTDSDGFVKASWVGSTNEGDYSSLILYQGDEQNFMAPVSSVYEYIVSREIPLSMKLENYEVLAAFQEILVRVNVKARNGSICSGVSISFDWLGIQFNSISRQNGIIELHLAVPGQAGSFNLSYQIVDIVSLAPSSGYFIIIVREHQVYNSQGVGIGVMVMSSILIVIVSAVPMIRRRHLIG